ncbi:MAG: FAD-binding oxidoreductase [Nitrospiria bacterium]
MPKFPMKIKEKFPFYDGTLCHIRMDWVDAADQFDFITGQFVTLSLSNEEKGTYFAISSAPEEREILDFLIKKTPGTGEKLIHAKIGDIVWVEGPLGKGFPIDQYKGKHLLLVGVGTGIAPLRSVYRSVILRRSDFRYVHLYYGVLTPAHFCHREEIRQLRKRDIQVYLTVTTPDSEWAGRTGFVQTHFAEAVPEPENSIVLLVGMKEMIDQSRVELLRVGFKPGQILLNY